MRELHLFAGAGGGILGGILLGHTCVCAVEIEPYCREVLLQRQRDGILPRFPIWDNVRTFDGRPWRGLVDVVCGGFPCQDISAAGKRDRGIGGQRSGLWWDMARIIADVGPRYVFIENSPRIVRQGLEVVLADLAEMGFDVQWGIVGAGHIGAPHQRDRFWLVGINPNQDDAGGKQESSRSNGEDRSKDCQVWNRGISELGAEHITTRFSSYTEAVRMVHGVANRVGRFAAIGNGQVPAVARTAWNLLGGKQR